MFIKQEWKKTLYTHQTELIATHTHTNKQIKKKLKRCFYLNKDFFLNTRKKKSLKLIKLIKRKKTPKIFIKI